MGTDHHRNHSTSILPCILYSRDTHTDCLQNPDESQRFAILSPCSCKVFFFRSRISVLSGDSSGSSRTLTVPSLFTRISIGFHLFLGFFANAPEMAFFEVTVSAIKPGGSACATSI